jgi:hypothetical protein
MVPPMNWLCAARALIIVPAANAETTRAAVEVELMLAPVQHQPHARNVAAGAFILGTVAHGKQWHRVQGCTGQCGTPGDHGPSRQLCHRSSLGKRTHGKTRAGGDPGDACLKTK